MSEAPTVPVVTEKLCESFALAADALMTHRENNIPEQDLHDFIALEWMQWQDDHLRVTPLGRMALLRIRNPINAAA